LVRVGWKVWRWLRKGRGRQKKLNAKKWNRLKSCCGFATSRENITPWRLVP